MAVTAARWRRAPQRAAWMARDLQCAVTNRARPRILVYTDSRGFNVADKSRHGTYVDHLRRRYLTKYAICPEKYTTIVDFLNFADDVDLEQFDCIVVHCGIVDFSPRPLSSLAALEETKADAQRFPTLFRANSEYHSAPRGPEYRGEQTTTLYSLDYLRQAVVPELERIGDRLVWVSSNRFVPGWEGTYERGRPTNIEQVVFEYEDVMRARLATVVDLTSWQQSDVKSLTVDNIHFTRAGFQRVAEMVAARIDALVGRRT